MAEVELRNVGKSFESKSGTTPVLREVNLVAESGRFVVLLGPSGCGKSTSLRIISGLESPTSGQVFIDGKDVTALPASQRSIAMVFQNYALYPHLTVMENITFGLSVRKVAKKERLRRGREAAEKVGLDHLLDRRPSQMSGGQRQRAALARALVSDARVVLMDEPLSNLDAKLRNQMRIELRALQRDLGLTVIYVTHDQVEAMTMADHVVVMRDGEVAQADSPLNLYAEPADVAVASFIGSPPMNVVRSDALTASLLAQLGHVTAEGDDFWVGVRPEKLTLGRGAVSTPCIVQAVEHLGAETLVSARAGEDVLTAKLPGIVRLDTGTEIVLSGQADDYLLFEVATGKRVVRESAPPMPSLYPTL